MGIKVLIIGGSETDYHGVVELFTARGDQVIVSPVAKRGLALVKREQPDLVLIALDLADSISSEAIKRIRKISSCLLFPIVTSVEQGVAAMKLGATHYFTKPGSVEEVSIVAERYLSMQY